mgnify:CR=1 FL=1
MFDSLRDLPGPRWLTPSHHLRLPAYTVHFIPHHLVCGLLRRWQQLIRGDGIRDEPAACLLDHC